MIDDTLKSNIKIVSGEIRKDKDWLWLNIGGERIGKSTFGWLICKEIDPTFNASRVVFTAEEFQIAVEKAKKYQALMLDEGVQALFSRQAMSRSSVDVVKMLTQCGSKNLFLMINVVDPFIIDKYIFGHRANTMTRIVRRGLYAFFSKKRMRETRQDKTTKITLWPEPNFYGNYSLPDGKDWEEYIGKATAYKEGSKRHDVLKKRIKIEEQMKKSYTLRDIATMYGFKPDLITRYYTDYNIFNKKDTFRDIFGQVRVTKRGTEAFIKKLYRLRQKHGSLQKLLKPHRMHRKGANKPPKTKKTRKIGVSLSNKRVVRKLTTKKIIGGI